MKNKTARPELGRGFMFFCYSNSWINLGQVIDKLKILLYNTDITLLAFNLLSLGFKIYNLRFV